MTQAGEMYKDSGVDIEAGETFADMIKERIKKAWPGQEGNIGGFAGEAVFKKPQGKASACADGTGTMILLAALANKLVAGGINAGAMSLFDCYCNGAHPVGLVDVIDCEKLVPQEHIAIIDGLILACKMAGDCVLIGGETAELPGMYKYDWAVNVNTFAIGEPDPQIVSRNLRAGQKVYGWPSYGLGSNGFSLARKVLDLCGDPDQIRFRLAKNYHFLSSSLAEALLFPAPVWINEIEAERVKGVRFAAHAHITGGGLVDNVPRVLPDHLKVVIDRSTWQRPPIFRLIQEVGNVSQTEMDRVFNQGIMAVSVVEGVDDVPLIPRSSTSKAIRIGDVVERNGDEPQVEFVRKFKE